MPRIFSASSCGLVGILGELDAAALAAAAGVDLRLDDDAAAERLAISRASSGLAVTSPRGTATP